MTIKNNKSPKSLKELARENLPRFVYLENHNLIEDVDFQLNLERNLERIDNLLKLFKDEDKIIKSDSHLVTDIDDHYYSMIIMLLEEIRINSSNKLNEILESVFQTKNKFKKDIIKSIISIVENKELIKPSEKILNIAMDYAVIDKSNKTMSIVVDLLLDFKMKPTKKMIDLAEQNKNEDILADFIIDLHNQEKKDLEISSISELQQNNQSKDQS